MAKALSVVFAFLMLVFCRVASCPAAEETAEPVGSTDTALGAAPETAVSTDSTLRKAEAPVAASLTVSQAIVMALDNNRAFVVERYNTPKRRNLVEVQQAVFDPDLTGSAVFDRGKVRLPGAGSAKSQSEDVSLAVSKFFPAGTTVGLTGGTTITQEPDIDEIRYESSVALSATQALLRGFGTDVNLASVRQARIDVLLSEYELRALAETLVASTEETYWDYVLALRQIEIVNESLKVAQQQMDDTRERIKVGQLAESEIFAAEAEVALRTQNLIEGRSILDTTRIRLLRLMNPPGGAPFAAEFALIDSPTAAVTETDPVDQHVAVALRMRPDINQAKLLVSRGQIEIVRTRNGLLPRLDLFASFGKSAYADSFGESITNLDEGGYGAEVGVTGEYPLGNRRARALHSTSVISRDQAVEAVANLSQLAEADVRSACIEVMRSREQSAATAATSRLQQEKVRIETAKFKVGKSTTLLVGQAQRDLLLAQIQEVQSIISYRKALVELYRLEGSLLTRRGVSCPGADPVTMSLRAAEVTPPPSAVTVPR